MRVKRRERERGLQINLITRRSVVQFQQNQDVKEIKSKSQFVPKIELLLMVVKKDWTKQKTFFEVVKKGKKMRLEYKGGKKERMN